MCSHESHNYWVKIVDFLIKAYFLSECQFSSASLYYIQNCTFKWSAFWRKNSGHTGYGSSMCYELPCTAFKAEARRGKKARNCSTHMGSYTWHICVCMCFCGDNMSKRNWISMIWLLSLPGIVTVVHTLSTDKNLGKSYIRKKSGLNIFLGIFRNGFFTPFPIILSRDSGTRLIQTQWYQGAVQSAVFATLNLTMKKVECQLSMLSFCLYWWS